MSEAHIHSWDDSAAEIVFPGITRQIVNGERQSLVRYIYEPGSDFPIHHHPEEQITVVVSGRIEFTVDGQTVSLGPGQVAIIPPNALHGARVTGDETVVTFNSLSPRRTTSPYSAKDGGLSSERG